MQEIAYNRLYPGLGFKLVGRIPIVYGIIDIGYFAMDLAGPNP